MGFLTYLIQLGRWNELEDWLNDDSFAVAEMNRVDRLGRSPLHYACAKKMAPAHIVHLMLDKVSALKTASMVDICGNTVLHAAAACGNASVVRVLLERLAGCCHILGVNDLGMTPLMMAWKKHLDASFTMFSNDRSSSRVSPIVSENIHDLLRLNTFDDLQHLKRLKDLWEKTCAICQAALISGGDRGHERRPLHGLISVGSQPHVQCPTIAMWLSIRFYRNHLLLPDDDGNLPLHVAILSSAVVPVMPLSANIDLVDSKLLADISTRSPLELLVDACPAAASSINREGRLPLHLAVESGKGRIYSLLVAYPDAMEQRDPISKLLPVLQGAASRSCSLSIVYELLRAGPDFLLRALDGEFENNGEIMDLG